MASPQLKKTTVTAPTRRLLSSAPVPPIQVRLKGANGKVFKPAASDKKPADPAPAEDKKKVEEAVAPTPAPEEASAPEEAAKPVSETPAAQEAPAPAPDEPKAEEAPAEPAEEQPAEEQPAEEQPTEDDEEARRAQEEYERQMEEYNRQMEEYNRQMEEYKKQMESAASAEDAPAEEPAAEEAPAEPAPAEEPAAEEAPAEPAPAEEAPAEPAPAEEAPAEPAPAEEPAAEEAPAEPAPAEKPAAAPAPAKKPAAEEAKKPALTVAKPSVKMAAKKPPLATAGAKKPAAAADDAKKAAPAKKPAAVQQAPAEGTAAPEAQMQSISADYVAQLERDANKKPAWKSTLFYIALGGLVCVGGLSAYLIISHNKEMAAMRERNAKVMSVLKRAQDINREGIETLAEAKAKGVNVKCSMKEVEFLMDIIVNPEMKDDKGKPMFGNKPEGVAQLAVLLVGLACEENADASNYVFNRIDKEAPKIKPTLYRWLVQRLAATNIKGINSKLRKLADSVSKKPEKGFSKRNEVVAYIWEAMGLRVSEKDIPSLIKLLSDPSINGMLAGTLANSLDNIILFIEDPAKKAAVGDQIFDALPEKLRPSMGSTLGRSCSPKALEYFKQRSADAANWRSDRAFFSSYASDDILPFLSDLKNSAIGDPKKESLVQLMINGVIGQNRDRSVEDARRMFKLMYDKVFQDISEWPDVNSKTDPASQEFVTESSPEYASLMEKRKGMEDARKQKLAMVNQLSAMYDFPWVVTLLQEFANEADRDISHLARNGLEKVKKNREADEAMRSKYKSRDKE